MNRSTDCLERTGNDGEEKGKWEIHTQHLMIILHFQN